MSPSKVAIVAPFANERVREWPIAHYREAVSRLIETHRVVVVGTRAQRLRANQLVRGFSSKDVVNMCGRMDWTDVVEAIDAADIVLANNSGVAQLAAARGTWTLCVFAGSHPYQQWRPVGSRAVTVSVRTTCSPCSIGAGRCPNDLACMSSLDPGFALEALQRAMTAPLLAYRNVRAEATGTII